MEKGERRPLASRRSRWAGALLSALMKTPMTANQVSILGILMALAGALALLYADVVPALFLLAALFVQLRLLANLMDGLVAVEGGRGDATGPLWNEVPDRLEDSLLLVAFGFAVGADWLGWLAALLAAVAAYVRLLGGTLSMPQDFGGPMAKPHRMAALTLACLVAFAEALFLDGHLLSSVVLGLVALGTAITILRRLRVQAAALRRASGAGGR